MLLKHQKAFTLVEVMIVIVILGIFSAMIGVSINSGLNRKNMQYHQRLINDLQYIRLVAMDEQQVMGLQVTSASTLKSSQYQLVQLNRKIMQGLVNPDLTENSITDGSNNPNVRDKKFGKYDGLSVDLSQPIDNNADEEKQKWLIYSSESQRPIVQKFDKSVQLLIEPLELTDTSISNSVNNAASTQSQKQVESIFSETTAEDPVILWFGNGEATPVKIILMVEDKQVGDAIFIDKLGRVSTDSAEVGL